MDFSTLRQFMSKISSTAKIFWCTLNWLRLLKFLLRRSATLSVSESGFSSSSSFALPVNYRLCHPRKTKDYRYIPVTYFVGHSELVGLPLFCILLPLLHKRDLLFLIDAWSAHSVWFLSGLRFIRLRHRRTELICVSDDGLALNLWSGHFTDDSNIN